jgi:hypothetical protein
MSYIVSASRVEPSPVCGAIGCVSQLGSRKGRVFRLATLNILRGQRFLPATAYVQFSRIDNEEECKMPEQVFASAPGSALRRGRSQTPRPGGRSRFLCRLQQAVSSGQFR